MNRPKLEALITIVLIGGAVAAYVGLSYLAAVRARQAEQPTATTTTDTVQTVDTEATDTPSGEVVQTVTTKTDTVTKQQSVQQQDDPAPTYVPPVINVTQNNYQQPTQQAAPQQEQAPAAGSAPAFVEPAPQTDLQIATDIAHLYDTNATVEQPSATQIRVHLSNGRSLTQDLTGNWTETLKYYLNRLAH